MTSKIIGSIVKYLILIHKCKITLFVLYDCIKYIDKLIIFIIYMKDVLFTINNNNNFKKWL